MWHCFTQTVLPHANNITARQRHYRIPVALPHTSGIPARQKYNITPVTLLHTKYYRTPITLPHASDLHKLLDDCAEQVRPIRKRAPQTRAFRLRQGHRTEPMFEYRISMITRLEKGSRPKTPAKN